MLRISLAPVYEATEDIVLKIMVHSIAVLRHVGLSRLLNAWTTPHEQHEDISQTLHRFLHGPRFK